MGALSAVPAVPLPSDRGSPRWKNRSAKGVIVQVRVTNRH